MSLWRTYESPEELAWNISGSAQALLEATRALESVVECDFSEEDLFSEDGETICYFDPKKAEETVKPIAEKYGTDDATLLAKAMLWLLKEWVGADVVLVHQAETLDALKIGDNYVCISIDWKQGEIIAWKC